MTKEDVLKDFEDNHEIVDNKVVQNGDTYIYQVKEGGKVYSVEISFKFDQIALSTYYKIIWKFKNNIHREYGEAYLFQYLNKPYKEKTFVLNGKVPLSKKEFEIELKRYIVNERFSQNEEQ